MNKRSQKKIRKQKMRIKKNINEQQIEESSSSSSEEYLGQFPLYYFPIFNIVKPDKYEKPIMLEGTISKQISYEKPLKKLKSKEKFIFDLKKAVDIYNRITVYYTNKCNEIFSILSDLCKNIVLRINQINDNDLRNDIENVLNKNNYITLEEFFNKKINVEELRLEKYEYNLDNDEIKKKIKQLLEIMHRKIINIIDYFKKIMISVKELCRNIINNYERMTINEEFRNEIYTSLNIKLYYTIINNIDNELQKIII